MDWVCRFNSCMLSEYQRWQVEALAALLAQIHPRVHAHACLR
jgi:hypothetical protein